MLLQEEGIIAFDEKDRIERIPLCILTISKSDTNDTNTESVNNNSRKTSQTIA
jgi:hypothetical protein